MDVSSKYLSLFERVRMRFICVEQVSPEEAKRLQKLRKLKFEEFEYGGELWWYHSKDLWYWESEVVA